MSLLGEAVKKVFFGDSTFRIFEKVYEPAEDTFLLAENLAVNPSDIVLDLGTGCGILGILAAKKARRVVAVDINPHAVHCTKVNAELNNVMEKIDIRRGNLFEPIKENEKFDLIIFNAPYLPSKTREEKTWMERAWAGGRNGRKLIDQFIFQAPSYLKKDGRVLLVQSTLSNINMTIQKLEEKGLKVGILAEKKVAFETIVVLLAEFATP